MASFTLTTYMNLRAIESRNKTWFTNWVTNFNLLDSHDHSSGKGVQIANAGVSNSAAIAYSKLNLAVSIKNSDIATSASIAYSKLDLVDSILDNDIATDASIAYSKLELSDSIVDNDVSSTAAIAGTKIVPTFGSQNLEVDGSITFDGTNGIQYNGGKIQYQEGGSGWNDFTSISGANVALDNLVSPSLNLNPIMPVASIAALAIDWSNKVNYKSTNTSSSTITFTGNADGKEVDVILNITGTLTSGDPLCVWPTIKWPFNTQPYVLKTTVNGYYWFRFLQFNSTIVGNLMGFGEY